jgi:hypothetical protein
MADAVRQLLRNSARAGDEFFRVVGDVLRRQAELIEMVQQVMDFRRAQQGFGRDAAPVQADAAELVALDERGLHAELRRPDRRDITARPAADHHQVESRLRHSSFLDPSRLAMDAA